jgi:O-antigen biosynthesis protein WbqP
MKEKKGIFCIYCRYVKRFLDVLFSIILLTFLLPLMLVISVLIVSESRGGAIFKQYRMGRNGKPFLCYKFRTMRKDAPHSVPANELVDSQKYVTRVGGLLRRSSLDELPQLFNVLRGEMSIVGPRPLICEEIEIHKLRESAGIYSLRPGLTGLAQVNGRNLLCDSEKIENDKLYLDNVRMRLDAKIIFMTVGCVFMGKGITGRNNLNK